MKKGVKVLISGVLLCCLGSANARGLEGSWEGKLEISPEMGLKIVFNIRGEETNTATVTMDSPDQGAYGIPMTVNYLENDSIDVSYPQLAINYRGKKTENSIEGVFTQGGLSLTVGLRPKTETRRPQTPQEPFDYNVEDVEILSAMDNAVLRGTLTTPVYFSKETPIVVLISGSGTQNRDEEIFEHKPFAVIADHLAKNGIGSLRYDDRGFDVSMGLKPNSTTKENALDALGAVNYLKDKGFKKIGLIGHSEGGLIADQLAAEGNDIAFVVEIGGPSVGGDDILIDQNAVLLRDALMPENYIAMYLEAMKGMFRSQKETDPTPFDESEYEIFSEKWASNPIVAPLAKNLKETFYELQPWLKQFINYNPINDIQKIDVPLLMIYGEKDTQVSPSLNVPVLEAEAKNAIVKVYPGLNHLMQHCKTGKVKEYGEIEETISTEVLQDITSFILGL